MCVLTENVRAGADSVQWDTGRLWFINTNQCVYIRHKLRIGGLYTVTTLAVTHTQTPVHARITLHVCICVLRLKLLTVCTATRCGSVTSCWKTTAILMLYFDKWGFVTRSATQLVKTGVVCSLVLEGALQSLKRKPDNVIRVVWVRAWDLKVKQKACSTNWFCKDPFIFNSTSEETGIVDWETLLSPLIGFFNITWIQTQVSRPLYCFYLYYSFI